MRHIISSIVLLVLCPAIADAEGSVGAEVIVVTASRPPLEAQAPSIGSKTGTDPHDVPAAIVVIPDAILRAQDVRSLDGALANASGVAPLFNGGYGLADNYIIRGLPMRFLRDGLPDGPSQVGYRHTLADVASIEVLKGPGSALYGRAEAGGSVNLTTRRPSAQPAIEASASVEPYDSVALALDMTGPLASAAAARFIGSYDRSAGFRGLGHRFVDLLPTVTVELGPHRMMFDYDHREQRTVSDNYGIPFTTDRALSTVPAAARFYSPFNETDQTIDRFTIADVFRARADLTLRAALVYDRRSLDIVRNAGASVVNAAGVESGRGGRTQTDTNEYWTAQGEAVWTPHTGALGHTILLGTEYSGSASSAVRRTYTLPNTAIVGGMTLVTDTSAALGNSIPAFDRRIVSDTLSIYAQDQIDIGKLVKVRAGARYDDVKLSDIGTVSGKPQRVMGTSGLWSWQAGVAVQPSHAVSLYGGYAQGSFVSIQTESTALSPVPERSNQIELGLKTTWFGGKLNANAAVFETRRSDFFVTLVAGGDPVQVGAQKVRGAELDIVGTPVRGLSIIGNAAYLDARNLSNALASITGLVSNVSTLAKRLASTPETSGALWGQYEVQRGPLTGVTWGAAVTYKGAVFADALELLRVPAYTVMRAAVGYTHGPIRAQLTVNNLGNVRYFTTPTGTGALPGSPRALSVTIRTRF